ncbi:MAG: hypothetical protein IKC81_00455 [Paludibacteraceae bacterium]|nr:hypothetical protein [Paludibacteraceae bacterium]
MKLLVKTAGVLVVMLALMCSCDFETQAYKNLRMQKDSIQALQQSQLLELENYLDLINEVDSGFEAIRESQNILTFASYDNENPSENMRQKVADNLYMINNLLAENQSKIAELEEKLQSSDLKSTKLQRMVNKLTADLKKKNAEVVELRELLVSKNYQIDSLMVIFRMAQDRETALIAKTNEQDSIMSVQDAQLHRAYFFVGNRKALRANDINVKDRDAGYRTELFTPVDVRVFDRLETGAKSAKILTKHPESSYELQRQSDKTYVLIIKNAADFWSASRYLIVQTR